MSYPPVMLNTFQFSSLVMMTLLIDIVVPLISESEFDVFNTEGELVFIIIVSNCISPFYVSKLKNENYDPY